MQTPFYLINIFTSKSHNCIGNPCAVVYTEKELATEELQSIATYLKQPATTFIQPKNKQGEIKVRWFAPDAEISICGHGAYAAFAALYNQHKISEDYILITNNGEKIIGKSSIDGDITMTMPIISHQQKSLPPKGLSEALGCDISAYHITNNKHIVTLEHEEDLASMKPNFELLRKIDVFGYSITALGNAPGIDFVSRTIVPHVQQLEDYATGSSHAALFPYWSNVLNRHEMTALQLSSRGGFFRGTVKGDGVNIKSDTEIKVLGTIDL